MIQEKFYLINYKSIGLVILIS